MKQEKILNNYYNRLKLNHPDKIGYVMDMIRELKPESQEAFEKWYYKNVRSERYVENLSARLFDAIPGGLGISREDCRSYVREVMFKRTYEGWRSERDAMTILCKSVFHGIKEAPKKWDSEYFIDFYVLGDGRRPMIGLQLKPESFFYGKYQNKVDIEEKMKAFERRYHAISYVLTYERKKDGRLVITNEDAVNEIRDRIRKKKSA